MHGFDELQGPAAVDNSRPWYSEMTRYHWFVLVVAALGWLFDCLDQQLFILARPSAMHELLKDVVPEAQLETAKKMYAGYATSIFLMGWATGGLFFGALGDRIGRAKTMLITILLYSAFTGLSALSVGFWDFAFYRFLTGLGVGGEFAVGVALVAEVMPHRARPYTLALLQALSAIGNISAALINIGLGIAEEEGLVKSPWRIMFLIGALPALLAVVIRYGLKEPEQWQKAQSNSSENNAKRGSYRALFEDPKLAKHALLGLCLACSGVIGLWAVGFFTPDLTKYVQRKEVALKIYDEQIAEAQKENDTTRVSNFQKLRELEATATSRGFVPPEELKETAKSVKKKIEGRLTFWAGITSMMINIGAFLGMFGFGQVSQSIGRKPTFAIGLIAAWISTAAVFWFLNDFSQLFWMVPIMGFCQLSLFAGYAIYFPELFPTRLRSTGTSFCYNVGRFIAATGPLVQASLIDFFNKSFEQGEPLRYAGLTMCTVFLVGLLVLPFLPETLGKPLPE